MLLNKNKSNKIMIGYTDHKNSNSIKSYIIALLILAIMLLNGGILLAQGSQTTENKADGNLKSSARVNPLTLAMEFSLPLGGYPGRGGNSTPVVLNYSSKVWESKFIRNHNQVAPTGNPSSPYKVLQSTDVIARYARKSNSGWVSSLQSPLIKADVQPYDQFGNFLSFGNITTVFDSLNNEPEDPLAYIVGGFIVNSQCDSGIGTIVSIETVCQDDGCLEIISSSCVIVSGGGGNGGPEPTPPPYPTPVPTPVPPVRHVVPRISVEMPDGSSHEFRKEDVYYDCEEFITECQNAWGTGTYLSVDGSAMRLVRNEIQPELNNETRDVLYLPNGSRYVFLPESNVTSSLKNAEKYIR